MNITKKNIPPSFSHSASRRNRTFALGAACFCILAACSLTPDLEKPTTALPANWTLSGAEVTALTRWWQRYNDPALNGLIERALEHNADLQLAAAHVAESRALLGGTQAEQYPSLSGNASATRLDLGDSPLTGGQNTKAMNSYSVAPVLSFEVDLWGRLANATEASRQQLLAEEANARAVRLAVIAEVASHYFTASALNEQIAITERTIKTRERAFTLQQKLFKEGDTDELTVRQAESELQAVQAELPALEQQRQQRLNALSVLSGASPQEIFNPTKLSEIKESSLPDVPTLPTLAPEQVVAGRPDIVRAEHQLVASNAQIGVARAAYLPKLSLTGLLGFQSGNLDTLFSGSPASALAGSLAGPILDFGRARAVVDASKAREKQAYISYEQTVRVAFREIMDALTGYRKTGERLAVQEKRVATLKRSTHLAQRRFDEGIAAYIDVLDAQRNLYQAETAMVETRRARLQTSVDLYKALGGGSEEKQQ
ncbi:MAG: RND transporter [Azospirillum brasilense]|nr:MAG: RND transporter [Azospirillum brasilense]